MIQVERVRQRIGSRVITDRHHLLESQAGIGQPVIAQDGEGIGSSPPPNWHPNEEEIKVRIPTSISSERLRLFEFEFVDIDMGGQAPIPGGGGGTPTVGGGTSNWTMLGFTQGVDFRMIRQGFGLYSEVQTFLTDNPQIHILPIPQESQFTLTDYPSDWKDAYNFKLWYMSTYPKTPTSFSGGAMVYTRAFSGFGYQNAITLTQMIALMSAGNRWAVTGPKRPEIMLSLPVYWFLGEHTIAITNPIPPSNTLTIAITTKNGIKYTWDQPGPVYNSKLTIRITPGNGVIWEGCRAENDYGGIHYPAITFTGNTTVTVADIWPVYLLFRFGTI
jgi:hypothetical protein